MPLHEVDLPAFSMPMFRKFTYVSLEDVIGGIRAAEHFGFDFIVRTEQQPDQKGGEDRRVYTLIIAHGVDSRELDAHIFAHGGATRVEHPQEPPR